MLVHKGGQINNVRLITVMGSAEMSHLQNCSVKISKEHCRYFTEKLKKKMGGCEPIIEVIEKMGGGGGVKWTWSKGGGGWKGDVNQELKLL